MANAIRLYVMVQKCKANKGQKEAHIKWAYTVSLAKKLESLIADLMLFYLHRK